MKIQPSRASYIPAGATKVIAKATAVTFYLFANAYGLPCALCFIGKADKPLWRYAFPTAAARSKKIGVQISTCIARDTANTARRAARNAPHTLKKGLILYTCWGYDQTNTEFYEVIDVPSACFVTVQQIGAPLVRGETSFMSGNVRPDPKQRIGEPLRRKVSGGNGRPSVRISSCVTAWVWDGRERLTSWYA